MPAVFYEKSKPQEQQPEFRAVNYQVNEFQSAFYIPLMVAGVIALVTVFLGILTLIALRMELWQDMPATVWLCAPALGGIVFITLFLFFVRWGLGLIEKVTQRDINGDGVVGEPKYPEMKVEVKREGGQQLSFFGLPFPDRAFRFVRATLNGQSNAERSWRGEDLLLTESEYDLLRDTLIKNGLAQWKNPEHHTLGWDYTEEGRGILSDLLKQWDAYQNG